MSNRIETPDAAWSAAFKPHAIIKTANRRPSSVTMCGLSGGAWRWLVIPLDSSRPAATFVEQASKLLPSKLALGADGAPIVPFYGEPLGVIVNYTPDKAVLFSLTGDPLETLDQAYRPGIVAVELA